MLIVLDESVESSLIKDRDLTIACLENVAESIRTNKHIVIGKKMFIKKICNLEELGKTSKKTFASLINIISEVGTMKKKVQAYIVLRGDIDEIQIATDKDGCKIYEVPICHFDNSEKVLPTRLVVEDVNDYTFYKMIANKYIETNKIGCNLSTHFVNGGGANTYKNYINEIDTCGAPCLVVVDSDKKSKQDKYGETAQNVLDKYNEVYTNHVTDYYILDVREKENLIPTKLYSWCSKSKDIENTIDILLRIEENSKLRSLHRYGDIKSGIKIDEILNNEYNKNIVGEYIKNEYENLLKQNIVDERLLYHISITVDKGCNSSRMTDIFTEVCKCRRKKYDVGLIFEEVTNSYDNSKKDVKLTDGIGWLMEDFQKEILGDRNEEQLKKKNKIYEQYPNAKLGKEVQLLAELCRNRENLFGELPNDIKKEWVEISNKIITWGCSVKINIAS